jgi:hypothetical protein
MTASRFTVAFMLIVGVCFAALAAEGQPTAKIPRLGYLGNSPLAGPDPLTEGLRELGWVDGKNIIIEGGTGGYQRALGWPESLSAQSMIVASAPPTYRQPRRPIIIIRYVCGF